MLEMLRCVRCGEPAADDLFVCDKCFGSQELRDEMTAATKVDPGYVGQRRFLIATYHWYGGWPRIPSRAGTW